MKRAAIIVNPVSGQARARRRARKLLYRLALAGVSVVLHETTGPGDGRAYAAQIAREVDVLVSVGGDGTLNEVVNGVLDAGAQTPILICCTGTANVVAGELGLPRRLPELVEVALHGTLRQLDVGVLRVPGVAAKRHFAMCVGAGFDAAVVECLGGARTAAGISRWTYAWPILRAFWRYRSPPMRVTIDGQELPGDSFFTLIANTRRYGGAFHLCPAAVPDDGRLDVCCLQRRGLHALLRFAWGILRGRPESVPGAMFFQGKTIDVFPAGKHAVEHASAARVPVQVDGDCGGELPIRCEVLPRAVNFCVAPQEPPAPALT